MRALRFRAHGRPPDVLALEHGPEPPLTAGTVRLRITHRPVNPADLLAVRGRYGALPDLPAVAGHEGLGVVDAVGEGVTGWQPGDRAAVLAASGTWQDAAVVPPEALWRVPEAVPDETAAQLVVNGLTAWQMLAGLGLPEGTWLGQSAAAGAVGRTVVQLARARGLRTLNLVRRPAPELDPLGADRTLVMPSLKPETQEGEAALQRLKGTVRDLTGGAGLAGALDAVGGTTGAALARSLAEGGTLVVYGALSGRPFPLDAPRLLFLQATVRGFWRSRWVETASRETVTGALDALAGVVLKHAVRFPVAARYPLEAWHEALEHARRPGLGGKVLLVG